MLKLPSIFLIHVFRTALRRKLIPEHKEVFSFYTSEKISPVQLLGATQPLLRARRGYPALSRGRPLAPKTSFAHYSTSRGTQHEVVPGFVRIHALSFSFYQTVVFPHSF